MAAVPLRFLAHCSEMTLPVSLSATAGIRRIFIFFSSLLLLSPARQLCLFSSPLTSPSLSAGLSLHASRSLFLSQSRSPHVTASPELPEWGMGEREEGWREAGKEEEEEVEEKEGEQTDCQARGEAEEFCRLPR